MNRKAYPTFNDWCPDECAIMVNMPTDKLC